MYNAQNNLIGYNVNKQYLTIIYHGKKKKGFSESNDIVSNMIHVKRLYQTILNIVQNHCNIAYFYILLC